MPVAAHESVAARLAELGALNAVVDIVAQPRLVAGGPLAGLPVAVKNIIDVEGLPTRCGSPIDVAPAAADALLVARLRAAGAAIVATTQCLEFAAGFVHPDVGDTRNPLDPALTAGGSSGGSAAVVATGAVPVAVGTDTGGSIRIPASYCGVPGIKPTTGWIPLDGVQALSPTLDCAGVFAATAAELWPSLAVMAGAAVEPVQTTHRHLVLGVLDDQFADASVGTAEAQRFEAALRALEAAGVQLRRGSPRWSTQLVELTDALTVIVTREAAEVHRGRDVTRYAEGTQQLLAVGETYRDCDEAAARARRDALIAEIDESLVGVDALVGPTVGFVAPVENPPFGLDDDAEARFTGPYNLSGHPAVSLPLGDGGMPLALQVAGRRGGDRDLIGVAAHLEHVLAAAHRSGGTS